MKHTSSASIQFPATLTVFGWLFAAGFAMGQPIASSPLTIETGITERGQPSENWTVDLSDLGPAEAERAGRNLSSRLYAAGPPDLAQPMTFKFGFEQESVFGFFLSRASLSGAALEVFIDDEFHHRLSWPRAGRTHEVDTFYYFPVSADVAEVRLKAAAGVVVIDRYQVLNTTDEIPADARELEPQQRPVAGEKDDGYRGIWFTLGQFSEYGDKYSGGLGTYTANHIPLAIHAEDVNKTFFVYGGAIRGTNHLLIMASYYDHERHRVPRPTIVHDKQGVIDPHDNPSISMDGDGHIWVFISGRGRGRPGFKYRSLEPYSVDQFEQIAQQELTYPQPWWVEGKGFIHMFTKYTRGRELYFETSPDGRRWSEDTKLAGILGHYQVSSHHNGKIGTFFNRHPGGSVDRRTDLYYAQTTDFGQTWTTADGRTLTLPLETEDNPARVIEYSAQGRLQYTVDLNWDKNGNPILLYVTSNGHQPGPANEPRYWEIAHWTGTEWKNHIVCRTTHNYDLGSLYVFEDRWQIIGPTGAGPQRWGTGGEMELWESRDEGETWEKVREITANSERNHTFARRPVDAADPFFAFWADGNTDEHSISKLYFTESSGERYWVLPYDMEGEYAEPREVLGNSVR